MGEQPPVDLDLERLKPSAVGINLELPRAAFAPIFIY
jgi:hypothetical protein